MDVREAGLVFCNPAAYANEAAFHECCRILRANDPVHRVEAEGFNPFWAITKHADLLDIERNTEGWLAAPRPALGPASQDATRADIPIRTLVQMDPPDHTRFREVGSTWFRPGRLPASGRWVRPGFGRAVSAILNHVSGNWLGAGSTAWPTWEVNATSSPTWLCISPSM
jgi:hypothetical protein